MKRFHLRLAVLSILLIACSLPATASAADSLRTTFLLSRSTTGGVPNGPSRNGAISNDQRIARVTAYESDATNIVAGDTNGVTDVFMVRRATPWGDNGTPWLMSATELVSTGSGGAPANGPSYKPAIDGSSHNSPSCVAFVSEASNLVRGDTNGVADAFVRDVRGGKITRVSVNSAGRQANGPTFEVSVSGYCRRIAFTSTATNLGFKRAGKLAWRSARMAGSAGGFRQVYVHVRSGKGMDKAFKGMTFLASSNDHGRPGNRDSFEPSFARAGKAVVFTSNATNLDRGDRTSRPDVYERTFNRHYAHIHGKGVQSLKFDTRLVSAAGRKSGNGPSQHASATDDGRYVAYETTATNLLPGDTNGVSDIARADMKRHRVTQQWVSRSYLGIGNGPSNHPVVSGAGVFVLFDSEATNLKASAAIANDVNGVRDLFLWNAPTHNVSLESRSWDNGYLKRSSAHPASSSRGNYVLFESAAAGIDELISNLTGVQQIYLRYLGPK
ncbi:MAG: hypothetical protein JJE27_00765 [Thermoleophilia bacterium]|nr:hypothetical protein [Thermoleophilia bacterium]